MKNDVDILANSIVVTNEGLTLASKETAITKLDVLNPRISRDRGCA